VIAEAPPDKAMDHGWLAVRIDDATEIAPAVEALVQRPEVHGITLFSTSIKDLWGTFKADYKYVAAAGGLVMDEDRRLLAFRRGGKWDLPKGKVEKGEGIEAAALREVREECGLRTLELGAALPDTWHTYERKGRQHLKRTHWFLMRGTAKDELVPQTDEDIDDVRWLDEAGLRAMKADSYASLMPVVAAWEAINRPTP